MTSTWMGASPEIDGNLTEWDGINKHVFGDGILILSLANDGDNLYVAGEINDQSLQQVIERYGLILWLDTSGGHRKQVEIQIPASTAARFDEGRGGFWSSYTVSQQETAAKKLDALNSGVFVWNGKTEQYHIFPTGSESPFRGTTESPEDTYLLELQLPLSFTADFLNYNSPGPGNKISLGIEVLLPREQGGESFLPGGFSGNGMATPYWEEYWMEVTLAAN